MIGLIAALVSFAYLAIGIMCARRTFRAAYAELEDTTEDKHRCALDQAMIMCAGWPVFGLIKVFLWMITTEHLVGVPDSLTDPWDQPLAPGIPRPERDGTDELIERLDKEINGMRVTHLPTEIPRLYGDASDTGRDLMEWLKHVPAEDFRRIGVGTVCPCGYRTECPVHCGDGHVTGACARVHREFM